MVQAETSNLEEEWRKAGVVELGSQGAGIRWDLPKKKLTWVDQWRLKILWGRGFLTQSAWKLLTAVGLTERKTKKTVQRLGRRKRNIPVDTVGSR